MQGRPIGAFNLMAQPDLLQAADSRSRPEPPAPSPMDFHLIANFAALALITLAGPAVIFILFFRRGAL